MAGTSPAHLQGGGAPRGFETQGTGAYEVRPSGNAVSLEDEMIKVAANQMDYQAAAALYSRSLALIKTALGKR
jgi:flagellar basal-body rod protein FlgB